MPGILSWPGIVKPNQVSSHVSSLMDLFSTALDLAGIPIPTDRIIDGKSLLDVVKLEPRRSYSSRSYGRYRGHFGETFSVEPGTHFFYRGNTLGAVRHGDYKMHIYTWSGHTASSKVN